MYNAHTLLTTKQLSIGYGKKVLHQNLMLQLNAGQMVVLIGPNGCGKSTLIRTLAGLQKPISGNIQINNSSFKKLSTSERAKHIAVVLTDRIHTQSLTVKQLVEMGRFPHTNWAGKLQEKDHQQVAKAIEQVHLTHKTNHFYTELSDGEKQRVMIAKALAQDTPIIFLDEPTSHLDLPNTIDVLILLKNLAQKTGKAILLSTHELELALQVADKLWLLTAQGIKKGIPEDIVLSDYLPKTFSSTHFYFDNQNGQFKVKHSPNNHTICLKGEESIALNWTKRALERTGYTLNNEADCCIELQATSPVKWTFTNPLYSEEYYLLENLLAGISDYFKEK
jgi:iron complex transport system ATP-binding protein